jgi:UDP-N-acetylmuramate: L-alanyl-gamma-D-glutamyl-meso-diaminopimelate ligase
VVEADEYDTAFFDKRAKFVHYRPQTAILNNLEFDHADIYPDVAAIRRMFHQLVRTVPSTGCLIVHEPDVELERTLSMGCWTPTERFGRDERAYWQVVADREDWSAFRILGGGAVQARVQWDLLGAHNAENALAAILAAQHAGVSTTVAAEALATFRNARRRLELLGTASGVTVYDDFAHHPTAIEATIGALRGRIGRARLVAVLEPRSATMKLGVHRDTLAASLSDADAVFVNAPADLGWDVKSAFASLGERATVVANVDQLLEVLIAHLTEGDHVLIMSNGGFGGLHGRLLSRLGQK